MSGQGYAHAVARKAWQDIRRANAPAEIIGGFQGRRSLSVSEAAADYRMKTASENAPSQFEVLNTAGQRWEQIRREAGLGKNHANAIDHSPEDGQPEWSVMADFTSPVGHSGSRSKAKRWSTPSVIEAKMMGIPDVDMGPPDSAKPHSSLDWDRVASQSRLPKHVIGLLIDVNCLKGSEQEKAADLVRETVHERDSAEKLVQEQWAIEAIAQAAVSGSHRTRLNCCACLRHLALDDEGSLRMIQSTKILATMAWVLHSGDDNEKQKVSAAIANIAWRSEDNRRRICGVGGMLEGILMSIRAGAERTKESALAAMSNITLSEKYSVVIAESSEVLAELATVLVSGSVKAQLRVAGIVRNMATTRSGRAKLLAFPGLFNACSHLMFESSNSEVRQRAEAALNLLSEYQDGFANGFPSRQGDLQASNYGKKADARSTIGEQQAISNLHKWLEAYGWSDLPGRLFDAGTTNYAEYAKIEPTLIPLEEKAGLYLWRGKTLVLVGEDRYNPLLLLDFDNRNVLWDFERETKFTFPWARRYFVQRVEAGTKYILLKRTGQVVAKQTTTETQIFHMYPEDDVSLSTYRSEAPTDRGQPDAISSPILSTSLSATPRTWPTERSVDFSLAGSGVSGKRVIGNPNKWRSFMEEGVMDGAASDAFRFQGQLLSLPVYTNDGLAVIKDVGSGDIVYRGPGRNEILLPPSVKANSRIVDQILQWADTNGWHDLPRRLIDAGKTDYSGYAAYEKQMKPIAGEGGLFSYQGKKLRLIGENRMNPRKLVEEDTKEVLWDFETATTFKHSWARQHVTYKLSGDTIELREKGSGVLLIQLQLAANRNIPKQSQAAVRMDIHKAIICLKEWVQQRGWYELQRRLFDEGETDYSKYAAIEPHMVPVEGQKDVFSWNRRLLKLVGQRRNPFRLQDNSTGELLWTLDRNTKFRYPWARDHFTFRPKPMQICNKRTGEVIAECEEKEGEQNLLLLQNIKMESIPMHQHRSMSDILEYGHQYVQAVREYQAENQNSQISLKVGDVLVISQVGHHGWNFGKIAIDAKDARHFHGDPLLGSGEEGWFPATFVVVLTELVFWKGRTLRNLSLQEGDAVITDALSGDVLFRGASGLPKVHWRV